MAHKDEEEETSNTQTYENVKKSFDQAKEKRQEKEAEVNEATNVTFEEARKEGNEIKDQMDEEGIDLNKKELIRENKISDGLRNVVEDAKEADAEDDENRKKLVEKKTNSDGKEDGNGPSENGTNDDVKELVGNAKKKMAEKSKEAEEAFKNKDAQVFDMKRDDPELDDYMKKIVKETTEEFKDDAEKALKKVEEDLKKFNCQDPNDKDTVKNATS